MGNPSSKKGGRGENDVIKILQPVFDRPLTRGRQAGGPNYCDVEGTPFWLEVKFLKHRVEFLPAMRQAIRDKERTGDPRPPIVVARTTHVPSDNPHGRWIAHLFLEDLVEILARRKISVVDLETQTQLAEAQRQIGELENLLALAASERLCEICRDPIPAGKRRDARTCSKACKQQAYRSRNKR